MMVVSWLGIFPTVGLLLHFVAPMLAVLMAYAVMPWLTRWTAGWLRG